MEFSDSEYDNELLEQIAKESPTFAALVRGEVLDFKRDCNRKWRAKDHEAIWLGSFVDGMRELTQVQLVITQDKDLLVDEN
ncbi:hypothetical protein [Shewanella sp. KCT]|uniref:hypothetical protein n=1 Tax=Shewanella sp. KCT TaxID=2569535 RepID=UPI001182140D|nr:hypothetical protein [Shewanella sp. KCT]TVP15373.1 hypothetical protein AYI87_06825 [Shewanella sp. KCT]